MGSASCSGLYFTRTLVTAIAVLRFGTWSVSRAGVTISSQNDAVGKAFYAVVPERRRLLDHDRRGEQVSCAGSATFFV